MAFVDLFMAPVPVGNRDAYLSHSTVAAGVFKEHGAISVTECWGVDIPPGQMTSMPMAVKLEDGETVVTGWVLWPTKEARDAGMAKVMGDPRMQPDENPMPLDGKRMIFGGFEVMLQA